MSNCPQIIFVRWLDSASTDGWHNPEHVKYEPLECVTAGFFVGETDTAISIASSIEGPEQICQVMTIPKVCVFERRVVSEDLTWPEADA